MGMGILRWVVVCILRIRKSTGMRKSWTKLDSEEDEGKEMLRVRMGWDGKRTKGIDGRK